VKGKELFLKPEEILNRLKGLSDSRIIEGMKKVGINSVKILGILTPQLRKIAREIGSPKNLHWNFRKVEFMKLVLSQL
jgi:3-methyladenine DNA glycosylase AlkD